MEIILNQKSELVAVGKLKEHPRNPRKGNLAAVIESIRANGFYGVIVAQRSTSYVLAGNHRLMAARELGFDKVPVVWVDVDDDQALRILLADNRTSDLAEYNDQILAELLEELAGTDRGFEGSAYTDFDLSKLLQDLTPREPKPAPPRVDIAGELLDKWKVERGQLWKLGRHRIICGDSTDPNDVGRLLGKDVPELMVTDPPYGVDYEPDWRGDWRLKHGGSPNNDLKSGVVSNDDRADWTAAWELFPGSVAYVWHAAGANSVVVFHSLEAAGLEAKQQIIWTKENFALGRGAYHYKHEPCWYAVRKGKTSLWQGDRSQHSVWEIPSREDSGHGHATQKPLECMRRPILNHKSEFVYEPFSGSGTTLIACEELGRKCLAVELEPKYVAIALERWHELTGKTPELI